MVTIFICALVVVTVIAAVVAGLHWAACAVPSSASFSQMNSAHLEVPISHYDAFPWITFILHQATERLALVWQYYTLWLGYIFYFAKVNARIAFAAFSIYFLRRDLICAGSYVLDVLHSSIRPLRSHSRCVDRATHLDRAAQPLTRVSHTFPKMIGLVILLSGSVAKVLGQ